MKIIITTCFDNRMKFKSGQTWTFKRKLTIMTYVSYNCVVTICYSSKILINNHTRLKMFSVMYIVIYLTLKFSKYLDKH